MAARNAPTGAPAPAALPKSSADDVVEVFAKEAKAVAEQAATQAKGGDVAAMRLVLERVAPAQKERAVRFDLPTIEGVSDLPRAQMAILRAVAKGELTPGEAQQLSTALESYRKQVETAEFEGRLRALEGGTNGRR